MSFDKGPISFTPLEEECRSEQSLFVEFVGNSSHDS